MKSLFMLENGGDDEKGTMQHCRSPIASNLRQRMLCHINDIFVIKIVKRLGSFSQMVTGSMANAAL